MNRALGDSSLYRTYEGKQTVTLTSGDDDVGQPHGGLDVLVEGRLHVLVVLLDDAPDVPAPLCDVPAEPPHQPDVRVRVHEDLHVQQLNARETHNDDCVITCTYDTMHKTSSARIGRYYTGQQLIAQLRQHAVKRQLNAAE